MTIVGELEKNNVCFKKGEITLIGSRTAMGKTSLALQIARELQEEDDYGIFLGMDMSGPLPSKEDNLYFYTACQYYSSRDRPNNQMGTIETLIKKISRENDNEFLNFVVFDGLQLFNSHYKFQNRYEELDYITRYIYRFAKIHDVHVILTSQLSKEVDERVGHRPMLNDVKDCSTPVEVADQVLFLLRRDYYDPCDKPGLAEIIIAKNREGKYASINQAFHAESKTFQELDPLPVVGDIDKNDPDFAAFNS